LLVKVLDFGIARFGNLGGTQQAVEMGTPPYMAPEQGLGQTDAIGPWSDVFSLGVMLLEMLTLCRTIEPDKPLWASVVQNESAVAPAIMRQFPQLAPELCKLILKALRGHPKERYQDAGEMRTAANAVFDRLAIRPDAATAVSGATPPSTLGSAVTVRTSRAGKRGKLLLTGGIAVMVVSAAVASVKLLNQNDGAQSANGDGAQSAGERASRGHTACEVDRSDQAL
jgi:serine/threonine protein kinase